jgi:hypothetical protein
MGGQMSKACQVVGSTSAPELHTRSPRFERRVGGNIILACRVRNVALIERRQMLGRQLQIPFAANEASKYNSGVDRTPKYEQ